MKSICKFSISKELFILFLFSALFAVGGLIQGIDLNWDLMNYHFYNAYSFINGRLLYDISPAQVQTYINPFFDLFTYFLLDTFTNTYWPIILILGAIQGVSGYFVYKIASLIFLNYKNRYIYTPISILIGLTGAAGFTLIGSTMTGWEPTIFVLASLYFALKNQKCKTCIFFSGLCIGIATGGKLTNSVYLLGLLFSLWTCKGLLKDKIHITIFYIFGTIAGISISSGFWFYQLYNNFNSPLFPFFNNIFHSPWAGLSSFNDERFLPRNIWQLLFYPFYWTVRNSGLVTELSFRDYRFGVIYILFMVYTLLPLKQNGMPSLPFREKFLYSFFLFSYMLWLVKFSIYRYLIPLEAISGIVIVLLVNLILHRCRSAYRVVLTIFVALCVMLTTVYPNWGRYPFKNAGYGYFRIEDIPVIEKGSIVLMNGGDAMSFLIPHYDSSIRFISVKNNFFDITNRNKMSEKAIQIIRAHRGNIYSFTMDYQKDSQNKYIDYLGFNSSQSECKIAEYAISDKIKICKLR